MTQTTSAPPATLSPSAPQAAPTGPQSSSTPTNSRQGAVRAWFAGTPGEHIIEMGNDPELDR